VTSADISHPTPPPNKKNAGGWKKNSPEYLGTIIWVRHEQWEGYENILHCTTYRGDCATSLESAWGAIIGLASVKTSGSIYLNILELSLLVATCFWSHYRLISKPFKFDLVW
jgi:hypothetical protein